MNTVNDLLNDSVGTGDDCIALYAMLLLFLCHSCHVRPAVLTPHSKGAMMEISLRVSLCYPDFPFM